MAIGSVDLSSGTTDGSTLGVVGRVGYTAVWQERIITLDTPLDLVEGTQYAIVARAGNPDVSAYAYWYGRKPGEYSGVGNGWTSADSGVTWTEDLSLGSIYDDWFDTGTDSYEPTPNPANPFDGMRPVNSTTWKAQIFTASDSYELTSVTVLLGRRYNYNPGTITVSIRSTGLVPTPADEATSVDWADLTISWEGGSADSYDVYFGQNGTLVSLGNQEGVTKVVPYTTDVDDNGVTHAYVDGTEIDWDVPFYWRIDSVEGETTTEGEVWWFDARPTTVSTPTPSTGSTDVILSFPSLTWVTGGNTSTYNLYFGLTSGALSEVGSGFAPVTYGMPVLTYTKTYYWRSDAANDFGVTAGTEWSFTTMRLKPPGPTGYYNGEYFQLLVLEDGVLGQPPPTGVVNVDYILVAYLPNFISTTKRLICAAGNKVWMEDL